MIEKTVIISDIHGCIDEFTEILKLVDATSPYVRVICLGDFLDRGPDSLAVVRKARQMNLESVCGNHEFSFLKWHKNAGSRQDVYDVKKYYQKFSEDDINYIFKIPTYIKLDNNFVVVHAGIKPGISISNQNKDDLMYLRYTDINRNLISLRKIAKIGKEAAGAYFWTEFGPFEYNVVYGHHVHSLENIQIDNFNNGTVCYGIDTGCCFGGRLSAFILETKEVIQVKAKQEYFPAGFDI